MVENLKSILLVEDLSKDVKLILSALQEHSLANRVDVARDGEEALHYLRRQGGFSERPDGQPILVILDLKLPKLTGLEVLREMKSDDHLKMIPVVVLSSSKEQRDLEDCYKLGVNSYVVKPVDFQSFTEAVRKLGLFWALVNEPPPGSSGGSGKPDAANKTGS